MGSMRRDDSWALRRSGLILAVGALASIGVGWLVLVHLPPRYASDRIPAPPTDEMNADERTANDKARADVEANLRQLGTQIIAGIAAVTAGMLTYGRLQLSRQEHLRETEAQITERYTRAIDQIGAGAAKPEVVLGGIYAANRIAQDSPADLPTIAEVLAGYLRQHRRRPHDEDLPSGRHLLDEDAPSEAAFHVVLQLRSESPALPLDLHGVDLTGVIARRANLSRANLTGANLTDANLAQADLTDANFYGADLTGIDLSEANLTDANLYGANLTGANLSGTNLTNTHLTGADLTDANLTDANLTDANLAQADLTGANLNSANLTDADLTGAHLNSASLIGANLAGADLFGAELTGANLLQADLPGADLDRANLSGANLIMTDLTGADLEHADLTDAKLTDAKLTGTNLTDTE